MKNLKDRKGRAGVTIQERLDIANRALPLFTRNSARFFLSPAGRVLVSYRDWRGEEIVSHWIPMSVGSMYPRGRRDFGHGGTVTTAVTCLVRWVRGQPTVGIGSWAYWVSDRVRIAENRGPELLEVLRPVWPVPTCVLCGVELLNGHDWWGLKKASGPCCNSHEGCRQTAKGAAA